MCQGLLRGIGAITNHRASRPCLLAEAELQLLAVGSGYHQKHDNGTTDDDDDNNHSSSDNRNVSDVTQCNVLALARYVQASA